MYSSPLVVPIGKESPGLWVDVRVCVPELSVAVGAVQDIVPVFSPLSVTLDCVLGQPLMTGFSMSDDGENEKSCIHYEILRSLTDLNTNIS